MKNKKNIIGAVAVVLLIFLIKTGILNISFLYLSDNYKDTNFNIITINSILVGFLFTSFGIFTSLCNTKTYKFLESTSFINTSQDYMLVGIYSGIISIMLALINIFISFPIINIIFFKESYDLKFFLSLGVLYTTFLSIIFFIFAVRNIHLLIMHERKKTKITEAEMEDIKNLSEKIRNS
ncbi:hypothetical protein [Acetoanaerobium noterae]|uniref:hypothetical protein n=1 Tax=Acetoanaerobium noterae TaxID=745369 RepID=UPI0032427CBA